MDAVCDKESGMCKFCLHCELFHIKFHDCYMPPNLKKDGIVVGKVFMACWQKPFYSGSRMFEVEISEKDFDHLQDDKKDIRWKHIENENLPSSLKDLLNNYFNTRDCILDVSDEKCAMHMERKLASWNE